MTVRINATVQKLEIAALKAIHDFLRRGPCCAQSWDLISSVDLHAEYSAQGFAQVLLCVVVHVNSKTVGPTKLTISGFSQVLNSLHPNENFCAMVLARLHKEAGRLVIAHKASPKPSTL